MTAFDRELLREMVQTPMPEPYSSWVSLIDCNECGTKSTVSFHILGHFCPSCLSSNTAILSKRPRDEKNDPPAEESSPQHLLELLGDDEEEEDDDELAEDEVEEGEGEGQGEEREEGDDDDGHEINGDEDGPADDNGTRAN